MESKYSVWTYNESAEWLAEHHGIPDMVIISGTLHDMHFAMKRMQLIAPDHQFEIRDTKDMIVTVREVPVPYMNPDLEIVDVGPRPARQAERKTRRRLGTRES